MEKKKEEVPGEDEEEAGLRQVWLHVPSVSQDWSDSSMFLFIEFSV